MIRIINKAHCSTLQQLSPLATHPNFTSMTTSQITLMRATLHGALCAVIVAVPITALLALVFRFPVPFDGFEGGIVHVIPSLFALVFYGVFLGGFVVLAIGGAMGGAIAHFVCHADRSSVLRLTNIIAVSFSSLALFLFSISDWIIGPW